VSVTEELLLSAFGSNVVELALAVLVISARPRSSTVNLTVTVSVDPEARVPRFHETVPVFEFPSTVTSTPDSDRIGPVDAAS
jgi:hypothetical protein